MEKEKVMMLVMLVVVVLAGIQAVQLVSLDKQIETGSLKTGSATGSATAQPTRQAQPASSGMVGGC